MNIFYVINSAFCNFQFCNFSDAKKLLSNYKNIAWFCFEREYFRLNNFASIQHPVLSPDREQLHTHRFIHPRFIPISLSLSLSLLPVYFFMFLARQLFESHRATSLVLPGKNTVVRKSVQYNEGGTTRCSQQEKCREKQYKMSQSRFIMELY